MSNWYGTSRSNYFRVKDETSFRKWTDCLGIGIFKHDDDPTLFAVHPGERTDDGSWPSYDLEKDEDIDFADELARHLLKGQIAVLMTAGAKSRHEKAARRFRVREEEITRAEH